MHDLKNLKIIMLKLYKEIGLINLIIILLNSIFQYIKIIKIMFCKYSKYGKDKLNFIMSLAILVAIYNSLLKKYDKNKSYKIMEKIIISVGLNDMGYYYNKIKFKSKEPIEKIIEYNNFLSQHGVLKYNKHEYKFKNKDKCCLIIKDCIFYNFFKDMDVVELCKLFCKVDFVVMSKYFPEIKFHRGSSYKNTIAYNKNFCVFVFEKNN